MPSKLLFALPATLTVNGNYKIVVRTRYAGKAGYERKYLMEARSDIVSISAWEGFSERKTRVLHGKNCAKSRTVFQANFSWTTARHICKREQANCRAPWKATTTRIGWKSTSLWTRRNIRHGLLRDSALTESMASRRWLCSETSKAKETLNSFLSPQRAATRIGLCGRSHNKSTAQMARHLWQLPQFYFIFSLETVCVFR